MQVYKIAWLLFKNNIKLYKFYMMILIFTIGVYYNFLAVGYNPYVSAMESNLELVHMAGTMCSFVLFFVLMFFMLHSSNFFYKQRYKEIATYILMGIQKKQIARVIAIESAIVGGIALVTGSTLGLLLSKLFFMVLGSASIMNVEIPFYFSMKPLITLIIIVAINLVIIAIRNLHLVHRSKLITLLNASRKEESMPKQRIFRGLLGVLGIAVGYYIALKSRTNNIEVFGYWPIILASVCIGTYLLFSGFFSMAIKCLIENKKISYKGSRLISLSNTLFRLESNYKSYAATTILCASTLTALMTSFILHQFAEDNVKFEVPYTLSYLNQDETINQKVAEAINASECKMISQNKVHFLQAVVTNKLYGDASHMEFLIVPYSEFKANLEMLNYSRKVIEKIKPKEDTVTKIIHAKTLFSADKIEGHTFIIGSKEYALAATEKLPFMGSMPNIGNLDTLIVTDSIYANLKKELGLPEQCLNNINTTNPEKGIEVIGSVLRYIPDYANRMNCYVASYKQKYYFMGAVYFLGLVLSVIFMVTVIGTIYFKCLSDAYSDQKQYDILRKIGISKKQIEKGILAQLGIAIILPVILGIGHSLVAVSLLEGLMHVSFWKSKLQGTGVFVVGISVFMIFMYDKYKKMVELHKGV